MAEILPDVLEDIAEGEYVDVTFNAVLDEGETLVNLAITSHRPNDGITIDGARFFGSYVDSFSLGSGGLKYRDTRDNTYHVVDKFSDLPVNPKHGHVYFFQAPSPLTTSYYYTVTLDYQYEDPLGIPPVIPEDRQLVVTVYQTVLGKWDTWGQQLRDYIAAGD